MVGWYGGAVGGGVDGGGSEMTSRTKKKKNKMKKSSVQLLHFSVLICVVKQNEALHRCTLVSSFWQPGLECGL